MGEYHERRDEIKGLLAVQLITVEELRSGTSNPVLNQHLANEAGRMLERYELLTIEHLKEESRLLPEPPTYTWAGFWWGVLQSFAATIAFIVILYFAAWLLEETGLDVFRPLRHATSSQSTP